VCAYVAACLGDRCRMHDEEPLLLPIFNHADDVVRRHRFASGESAVLLVCFVVSSLFTVYRNYCVKVKHVT